MTHSIKTTNGTVTLNLKGKKDMNGQLMTDGYPNILKRLSECASHGSKWAKIAQSKISGDVLSVVRL